MIINQRNNESYGPHSAMSVGQVKGNGPPTSEPHTGARPSVRLCVGPSLLAVFIRAFLFLFPY
jgi:hypothetical protein